MSPTSHSSSSRGGVMRNARPPQSMHVISGLGSSTEPACHGRPRSHPTRHGWTRRPRCAALESACVRVVAGELRGRRIVAPPGATTRPTSDRVREAVFNALGSLGVVDGAAVADLYAGSGAMGIEALSRGAASCTFVERDRDALRALRENIDSL